MLYFGDRAKHKKCLDFRTGICSVVCADIPDPNKYPKLYHIIKNHIIHGPCGSQNPKSPCMDRIKNVCTKNFPEEYIFNYKL